MRARPRSDARSGASRSRTVATSALLLLVAGVISNGVRASSRPVAPTGPALIFDEPAEGYSSTYFVRVDGTGVRPFRAGGEEAREPAWAPDGHRIAFSGTNEGTLFVADLRAGARRALKLGDPHFVGKPRWSPDGRRLAYERDHGIGLATIGKSGHDVVLPRLQAADPDWSPDGRQLAFARTSERGEPGEIYVVNVDGTGLRRVVGNGPRTSDSGVRWSPDGRTLLFVRLVKRSVTDWREAIYSISATGRRKRKLLSAHATSLAWSPDGRRFAYVDEPAIHIVTVSTRTDRVFRPLPCRRADERRYEWCWNIDWRPATRR